MQQKTASPPKATVRGQRAINRTVRAVLATPVLHRLLSRRLLTIEIRGRTSRRLYRTPVGYVRTPDGLLIGTAGRWRRNIDAGDLVAVRLAGKRVVMRAEVVTDPTRCARYYAAIVPLQPLHARVAAIRLQSDGSVDEEDLRAALARGIAVVRLLPRDAGRP
jgi:deazaflavin-dependent oxidoreductase (nitroreductase family)